ncbi:minor tail protein [Citrobacter phage HCF1]|uniref:Minor tail protein n=1 Tax=Citrobacter phage HCF1 TaxID=2849700 RepID=A0ABX6D3M5_9CAUD|nr:minor tail protein [Citrobacter phage HCF1]
MIRSYNGMMQAKVTIWITAAELMDEAGNVEDGAYRKLVYYVERPSMVNKSIAEFELTSPYDAEKRNVKFENCLQRLYPGSIITLIEVDATKFGGQIYRMHSENVRYTPEELLEAQKPEYCLRRKLFFVEMLMVRVHSVFLEMDGIMIPARITQSVCYWAQRNWYRSGKGCGYNGNRMFDKDNKPVSDPSLDRCAGTVTACKLRFGESNPLDFGGAAVASPVRRNQYHAAKSL